MATTEKKDIFGAAKKAAPATTKGKADDRPVIVISEAAYKPYKPKLKQLQMLRQEVKTKTAEMKLLDGELNDFARERYLELYKKLKRNPGAFHLDAGEARCLAIPANAYASVSEEKAEELRKAYGKDVVEETESFTFNADVLERHRDAISKAIMSIKGLTDEDKENLLTRTVTYKVASGTIDRLLSFKKPDELFEDIRPTLQLKF